MNEGVVVVPGLDTGFPVMPPSGLGLGGGTFFFCCRELSYFAVAGSIIFNNGCIWLEAANAGGTVFAMKTAARANAAGFFRITSSSKFRRLFRLMVSYLASHHQAHRRCVNWLEDPKSGLLGLGEEGFPA